MSLRQLPSFIATLVLALGAFTTAASADSYNLIYLGPETGGVYLYGIDTSGYLVTGNSILGTYYETSPADVTQVFTTPPSLSYNDGGACTGGVPAGFSVLGEAVCNNGHEVFGGSYDNPALFTTLCSGPISGSAETIFCGNHGYLLGIFTGFDPFNDWIQGSGDQIVLNASGDFGVIDAARDSIYLAIDLTPEPSSVVLAATGCIVLLWVGRRRLLRA